MQLLRHYKIFPKKRFGQNFMTDEAILHAMASHAALRRDDVVLEIGAGLGGLTRAISPFCKTVVAVEADRRFIDVLRKELADFPNITLVEGDVLKAAIPKFNKVVSNPPFHISSPILFWLFHQNFELAVLTFQKEFARRLTGSVGSKDYSRLTVETYYRAEVELLENVPKEAFFPPPKVDATIVRLKPWKTQPFRLKNEKAFHELVRALFTQRNRKVRNAVQSYLREKGKKRELADSLPFHYKRVRELAPEDFGALADELVS
jgi:16S rRNA (adenine1518-N6/adenine1519-N6)-dimethyltransferase